MLNSRPLPNSARRLARMNLEDLESRDLLSGLAVFSVEPPVFDTVAGKIAVIDLPHQQAPDGAAPVVHVCRDAWLAPAAGQERHFYSLALQLDGTVAAWTTDGNGQGVTIAPPAPAESAFAAVYGRALPSARNNVVAVADGYFAGLAWQAEADAAAPSRGGEAASGDPGLVVVIAGCAVAGGAAVWLGDGRRSPRRQRVGLRGRPASRGLCPTLELLEDRLALASNPLSAPIREVVFFESNVAGWQTLAQGLAPGSQAVVLDSSGDGLNEMAAFLAGWHDLQAVEVVAHGEAGALDLGATRLDALSLAAHAAALAEVKAALAPQAELDLWSCNVAAGPGGAALVQGLASATGAAVAASNTLVGAADLGGSWDLDVRVGNAQATLPFSANAVASFDSVLPVASITNVSPGAAVLIGTRATTITWTNTNFTGNVDILLSTNGGSSFSPIATNQSNSGSYAWTVPTGVDASTAEISVQATSGGSPQGASGVFTIIQGGNITTVPGVSGVLNSPEAVAVDSHGDLFIADTSNNVIREVNGTTGAVSIVAGNGTAGSSGDGGAATSAKLNQPAGVAVDSAGDLFIADTSNNRIREVNASTHVITTVAGNGSAGSSGDGSAATSAKLNHPESVAVDGAGDLFIADTSNNRIREVNASTHKISTVAGNGTAGSSGDGGAATSAKLNQPAGVAVDSAGDLFIADTSNNRIREVNASTHVITTVAGNGSAGSSGDGSAAASAALSGPYGVAVDGAGDLFIADTSNHRIREVNASTHVITTVVGNGLAGSSGDGSAAASAALNHPDGVAVDSRGDLLIADTSNNVIRETAPPPTIGNVVVGGPLLIGTRSTSITWTNSNFTGNVDILLSTNGGSSFSNIATNQSNSGSYAWTVPTGVDASTAEVRVQATSVGSPQGTSNVFTLIQAGVITTVPGVSGVLSSPNDVVVDSQGDLFIADTYNAVIREVNGTTGAISIVAGNGTDGSSGNGGAATKAELDFPEGVAVDSQGDLFIADADNNVIREVNATTHIITTVAGNGYEAESGGGYSGDGGLAISAELYYPSGVAVDSQGDLFIADQVNQRIREVNATTHIITTVAGNGYVNTMDADVGGYSGDNGPAVSAELNYPLSVAVDSQGDLFIADYGNNVIREVNGTTHIITTVAGNGYGAASYPQAGGYSGDNGPATSAELNGPDGVAVDSQGDLFIADYGNNVIREVNGTTQIITTVAGNGYGAGTTNPQPGGYVYPLVGGYSGDNGPATSAELFGPGAVAVDSQGDLFIADTDNNVIREEAASISTPTITSISPSSGPTRAARQSRSRACSSPAVRL